MRLVFIRHGQTPSNCVHALDTAPPGANLDEVGKRQARRMADRWPTLVGRWPDLIYASDLARTQQTAAPLAISSTVPVRLHQGLREVGAGELEMRNDPQSLTDYLDCAFSWIGGNLDCALPGGADGHETTTRLLGAVEETVSAAAREVGEDATIALVTHGVACRVMISLLANNVPPALVSTFPMGNATISVVERETAPHPWSLRLWSDQPLQYWQCQLAQQVGNDEFTTPQLSPLAGEFD